MKSTGLWLERERVRLEDIHIQGTHFHRHDHSIRFQTPPNKSTWP